jgi:hypothetical protein
MVAAGEYDAFEVQGKHNISIISTEGAIVTTENSYYVDIGPIIGDIKVMAVVNASENINIEGINFDGTECFPNVGIAYLDSTGSVADLTVENIFGTAVTGAVGIVSDAGSSVVALSDITIRNVEVGVGVCTWNAEASLDGCSITETQEGIEIGCFLYEFDPSTVTVQGCTISDNYYDGIWVCDDSMVEAHFNNIAGNGDYGVLNDGSETVDATNNWWGDDSGPSGSGPGYGDAVSDNVDFEPWLGAESVTETVTDDTVDATEEADTEVEVDGTAMVTVAPYDENPGGSAPSGFNALGKWADVCVPDTTEVTEIEIRLYYTDAELAAADVDEESLELLWWDGDDWTECSDGGVNTDSIGGYSGYMWAKIRSNTTPSLAQLQGTEFGGYEHPTTPPSGGCFIATAAYGTETAREIDILREFRDEVLLPDSLGAKFVSLYYRASPPIAKFISQYEVIRTVVRVGLVDPIVRILNWSHDLWSARG